MITRENYEEFFLLYTDNELSVAERQEVERFVNHHPDLREEWEALLQCRLSSEQHIGYPDKQALRRTEAGEQPGSAAEHRYTDYFLSYIDGELDAKDRAKVEALLREPRHLQELGALQRTISRPDPAIVFPDKARLYRKEKDRRIISLPWIRLGAAAAIAGAVALVFLLAGTRRHAAGPEIVLSRHSVPAPHPTSAASATGKTTSGATKKITATVTPLTTGTLYTSTGQRKQEKTGTKKDPPARVEKKGEQQDLAVTGNRAEWTAILPRTTEPVKGLQDNPITALPSRSLQDVGEISANVHLAVQTGIPKEQSSFATQHLREEANDQQNNNFVADETAVPAKGKLRGIFRKVTRVFGKTADRDKDGNRQVLVGAFQFALN